MERQEIVLQPGMFFTIEPMINIGTWQVLLSKLDGWTVTTKDKSLSAQFEHTVAVTETGYEIFTKSTNGKDYQQTGYPYEDVSNYHPNQLPNHPQPPSQSQSVARRDWRRTGDSNGFHESDPDAVGVARGKIGGASLSSLRGNDDGGGRPP